MDARQQLFSDIVAKLHESVPEVQHIALWNQDTLFLETDDTWPRPAVFVEFDNIEWQFVKETSDKKVMRGNGGIHVHIVTDWVEGEYEKNFEVGELVWGALDMLAEGTHEGYSLSAAIVTKTNHDHEELLENIDTYAVRYLKQW